MRNAVINANSPKEDICGVLTGVWNDYRAGHEKKWHVTKTPFFIHIEGVMQAGRNELPIAPNDTKALSWTSKDKSILRDNDLWQLRRQRWPLKTKLKS